MDKSRRNFLISALGASAALTAPALSAAPGFMAGGGPRVIIIGGGFGGLACARELAQRYPKTRVTLIEPKHLYTAAPTSNWVIGGFKRMSELQFTYQKVMDAGIEVIHDWVTRIDPERRHVHLLDGRKQSYDKLVVSPGIGYDWSKVEGLSDNTLQDIPSAWKDAQNTYTLLKQLQFMPDGGTVAISIPPPPYRCPPAPYERASMIALYLKHHKPRSKVIILDSQDSFGMVPTFEGLWEQLYGYGTDNSLIEWISGFDGGKITRVDPRAKTLHNDEGDTFKADVINYIPHQIAHQTARHLELTDHTGWCPIDAGSFRSTIFPHIHVIGDAAIANPIPKSGFAALGEGRAVATWIINEYAEPVDPINHFTNRCFSLAGADMGLSVLADYSLHRNGKMERDKLEILPYGNDFKAEADAAKAWFQVATRSLFD